MHCTGNPVCEDAYNFENCTESSWKGQQTVSGCQWAQDRSEPDREKGENVHGAACGWSANSILIWRMLNAEYHLLLCCLFAFPLKNCRRSSCTFGTDFITLTFLATDRCFHAVNNSPTSKFKASSAHFWVILWFFLSVTVILMIIVCLYCLLCFFSCAKARGTCTMLSSRAFPLLSICLLFAHYSLCFFVMCFRLLSGSVWQQSPLRVINE